DRTPQKIVRRPDVLALHAALRDLALHHRVLPRRRSRHGRHVFVVTVHFDSARTARDRDADLPRPIGRARTQTRPQGRGILTVPEDAARLDVFLTSVLGGLSRSQIQRLIKDGHVRVGDRDAKANQPVKAGQTISVDIPEPTDPTPKAEELPLPILYQDSDLIVIDKPAGMVVHPA